MPGGELYVPMWWKTKASTNRSDIRKTSGWQWKMSIKTQKPASSEADIVERCDYETSGVEFTEADESAGLLRGVKLLGLRSRNRRSYDTDGVRESAPKVLVGARIFIDHPADPSTVRSYRDSFGVVESVEYRAGKGWFGDIRFNPKHQVATQFAWDVRNNHRNMGFSINGRAQQGGRDKNGDTVVESLLEIRSVDVVTRPGTTNGIFESEETPVSLTVEELKKNHPDLVAALVAESAAGAAGAGKGDGSAKVQEQMEALMAELQTYRQKEAQQRLLAEVAEQFGSIVKGTVFESLLSDVVECACQMGDADKREKLANLLKKAGPLFSDDGQDIVAEESEKPVKAVAKVGSHGAAAYRAGSLRAALGAGK